MKSLGCVASARAHIQELAGDVEQARGRQVAHKFGGIVRRCHIAELHQANLLQRRIEYAGEPRIPPAMEEIQGQPDLRVLANKIKSIGKRIDAAFLQDAERMDRLQTQMHVRACRLIGQAQQPLFDPRARLARRPWSVAQATGDDHQRLRPKFRRLRDQAGVRLRLLARPAGVAKQEVARAVERRHLQAMTLQESACGRHVHFVQGAHGKP